MRAAKKISATEAFMQDGNESALKVARGFRIKLDHSDASIKKVERMLGMLHRHLKKTKDDEGLRGLALIFAAYIGEVIRKKGLGGEWKRDHRAMGKGSFPFRWRGSDLFPFGWCLKRIFDGSADNVWTKYDCFVLQEIQTEPNQRVESNAVGARRVREPRSQSFARRGVSHA